MPRPRKPPPPDAAPAQEEYVLGAVAGVVVPEKPVEPDFLAMLDAIEAGPYTIETAMAEAMIVLRAALTWQQPTPALNAVQLRAKLNRLLIDQREDTVRVTLEDLINQVVDYRKTALIDVTPEGTAD